LKKRGKLSYFGSDQRKKQSPPLFLKKKEINLPPGGGEGGKGGFRRRWTHRRKKKKRSVLRRERREAIKFLGGKERRGKGKETRPSEALKKGFLVFWKPQNGPFAGKKRGRAHVSPIAGKWGGSGPSNDREEKKEEKRESGRHPERICLTLKGV